MAERLSYDVGQRLFQIQSTLRLIRDSACAHEIHVSRDPREQLEDIELALDGVIARFDDVMGQIDVG